MNKIAICLLVLLVCVTGTGTAAALLDHPDAVKEAQEYGIARAGEELDRFLLPWQSFEETAARLNESAERAYLYTHFLLVAADARNKIRDGQNVAVADGEALLRDYQGYWVFDVFLFGDSQDFLRDMSASLSQGQTTLASTHLSISETVPTAWTPQSPRYVGHCYVYFPLQNLKLDKPAVLQIAAGSEKKCNFYFDLAAVK